MLLMIFVEIVSIRGGWFVVCAFLFKNAYVEKSSLEILRCKKTKRTLSHRFIPGIHTRYRYTYSNNQMGNSMQFKVVFLFSSFLLLYYRNIWNLTMVQSHKAPTVCDGTIFFLVFVCESQNISALIQFIYLEVERYTHLCIQFKTYSCNWNNIVRWNFDGEEQRHKRLIIFECVFFYLSTLCLKERLVCGLDFSKCCICAVVFQAHI